MNQRLLNSAAGWIFASAAASALSGCAVAPGEIFNKFNVHDNTSLTTDARQRVITNQTPQIGSNGGFVVPSRIVCSEPSPDVAAAVATSFGASLSVLNYGAGALSAQAAEGLIQLAERAQSIQALRERMFRACEAYSNGAITGTTYSLLLHKIGRELVTVSLGETAGGRFGRSLGALGGKSSSEAQATLIGFASGIQDIGEASKKLAAAETELVEADAALTEATGKPEAERDAENIKNLTAARDQAKARRNATRDLLQGRIDTTTKAAGEISTVTAAGGISAKPDAAIAQQLRAMQEAHLDDRPVAGFVDACAVELGKAGGPTSESGAIFMAIADSISKKGSMAPDDARGLSLLAPYSRSYLSEFCTTHLPGVLTHEAETHRVLKRRALDIEFSEASTREQEARARALESYAALLKRCDALPAAERGPCRAAVEEARRGSGGAPTGSGQIASQR